MRHKSLILLAVLLVALSGTASAQPNPYPTKWAGNQTSHPSDSVDCGEYKWPEVSVPCLDVQIKQKHDHTSKYRHEEVPWSTVPSEQGWDTAIECTTRDNGGIILSCAPYIPAKYFDGYYAVDTIPYNPPDSTFYLSYNPTTDANNPNKKKLAITNDDDWAPSYVNFSFPFYFFGVQKNKFLLGDNGIVTFATPSNYSGGQECPYQTTTPLPWPNSVPSSPAAPSPDLMRDAIYGVYEDTFTGSGGAYMSGLQGIYYGVVGEEPCRKIIASWYQIPIYNNSNIRETYQIACYEGSNIVEVHIKELHCGSSTNGGNGLIGIQNATGTAQVKGPIGSTTYQVYNGAPAAFWPTQWGSTPQGNNVSLNVFNFPITYKAYRFTPQGQTPKNYHWYRLFDNDSLVELRNVVEHPDAQDDTNGYYYPMGHMPSCPTLSLANVNPTTVSRYVFHLYIQDANNNEYDKYDTIVIGQDTSADMNLHVQGDASGSKSLNVCAGSGVNLVLEYPAYKVSDTTIYSVYRMSKGQRYDLDVTQCLDMGTENSSMFTYVQPLSLRSTLPTDGMARNKIDSIYIQVSINFTSGCFNYDTFLVCVYPNFDTVLNKGICQGESFYWDANGKTYTTPTHADAHLQSVPGCDSTVHLNLTVDSVAYVILPVSDCRPYTWDTLIGGNGRTYYESNNATAAIDTVQDTNRWGCDSITQLSFTYLPVTAHIIADREYFDFDHLDAVLTDVSENNHARVWQLPGGAIMTGTQAFYTIPAEYDEADITLVASATYDDHSCYDTANIVIPMRKENFWLPNAFTPGSTAGNNTFGSISLRTRTEEMYIYNRQGALVFHCDTPDCQWDGRDLNGNPCPQGTYMYFIRYTNEFLPKVTHVLRGSVTLIR